MPFNLRQIEVFRLVMRTRNLTESARLLRISQPAVSQSLKELEARLGLKLFERSASRISPTGEARLLLPELDRLFAQVAAVEGRVAELRDEGGGSLSLASSSNFAGVVLPSAIASFAQERPRVRITINAYVEREAVVRQVRQEGADLGFLYAPIDDVGLAAEPIMTATMACVFPEGSPLAELEDVSLTRLLQTTVIIASTSGAPSFLLRSQLDQLGARVEQLIETNFSYAALGLVRAGMGVFVTDPIILMSGLMDGLAVRPLTPQLPVTLTAVYPRQRPVPRLAVRFIAHLRPRLREMAETAAPMGCGVRVI